MDGFAEDGVAEIAAAHIQLAVAAAAPIAAAPAEHHAGALGLSLAGGDGEDLAGAGVHHAPANGDDGFGFLHAEVAETVLAEAVAPAGNALVAVVATELGDAADDDGVDAEDLADLGGGGGVGAVAIGEILLGEDFVQRLALDDRKRAVGDQTVHQQIGDAFADVLVAAKELRNVALHGGVVEVQNGDAFLRWLAESGRGA